MGCGSGKEGIWVRRFLPITLRILMRHRCVSLRGHPERRQSKGRCSRTALQIQVNHDNSVQGLSLPVMLFVSAPGFIVCQKIGETLCR